MKSETCRLVCSRANRLLLAAALACCCRTSTAALTNEGFDTPYDVNTNLPVFEPINTTLVDQWAAENALIVAGVNDGISPLNGDQMVKLLDDGTTGAKNEMKQRIDVSLDAAAIDAGLAVAIYFAHFNVPSGPVNARAEIYLNYLDALGNAFGMSPVLDSDSIGGLGVDVSTWQVLDLSGTPVPIGTRFIEAFIQYDNASLGAFAGYVDATHLSLRAIPEPATWGLFITAMLGTVAVRRTRRS
mgnify:CR=1 FL=1